MCKANTYWSVVKFVCLFGLTNSKSTREQELSRHDITAYMLNPYNYDKTTIPDFDADYPTNVTVQVMIHSIHTVDELAMEYSMDIYLRMWWRDYRLAFANFTSSTEKKLELDATQIDNVWQPNIFFENEKRAFIHTVTTTNKLMHIFNDGSVVYSIRLSMALNCNMYLRYYPFDAQTCPLLIQSFCYTTDNIDLHWHKTSPVTVDNMEMPQYSLLEDKIKTADTEVEFIGTGSFSTLTVELHLSRKLGYYFLQVFFPSIFLVVLSWVSFWVDPTAVPARVSLGVTCVLTMTTQIAGVQQSLPPVSYVKAIDVWMFVCLLLVFAALLEFACVNVILRKKPEKHKKNAGEKKVIDTSALELNARGRALKVDKISRFLFPSTFILFSFIFFTVCGVAQSA